MLVLPSFDEGFGLPVLEAMAPRRAGRRLEPRRPARSGGDAGLLVDPDAARTRSPRRCCALLADPLVSP